MFRAMLFSWQYRVVPVTVEFVFLEANGSKGLIRNFDPRRVRVFVQFSFSQKIETPYGTGTWRENFATCHRVETSWRLAQWPVTLSRGTDQSSILSAGIPAKSCRLRVTRVASRLRAMAAIRRSSVPIRILRAHRA